MSDNNAEIYDRIHWPADTYADGLAFLKRFLGGDGTSVDEEIGNGTAVFDHNTHRAEKFFVAGNGPSAWVWFVFTDDRAIDHAYMEYSDGHLALLPIPFHLQDRLLAALREDVKNGINR
jgi:hypothetical protein